MMFKSLTPVVSLVNLTIMRTDERTKLIVTRAFNTIICWSSVLGAGLVILIQVHALQCIEHYTFYDSDVLWNHHLQATGIRYGPMEGLCLPPCANQDARRSCSLILMHFCLPCQGMNIELRKYLLLSRPGSSHVFLSRNTHLAPGGGSVAHVSTTASSSG